MKMIETKRTVIHLFTADNAELLWQFYDENRNYLAPWEPLRDEVFFTRDYWQQAGRDSEAAFANGTQYRLIALSADGQQVLGFCNFSNVVRGAFQACHLGYGMAENYAGQGYMTEILQAATRYMFDEVGLHRIMANYMPRNEASGRVLEKLGFEREGYAKRYLNIAGQWEDHILTAKINPLVE